jgi:quercetin 2,3-dioxygenase
MEWGKVRVVSGEIFGVQGPLRSVGVNPVCLDIQLGADQTVEVPVAYRDTAVVYLFGGEVEIGGETVVGPRLVVLGSGDIVLARAGGEGVRFFIVSAAALSQPVMQYRSLVMTTVDEMGEAVRDLAEGRFTRHEDQLG